MQCKLIGEISILRKMQETFPINLLKCYVLICHKMALIISEYIINEVPTTWSTLYIEIGFSNTGTRWRRRSSILLRFCRAEYCASPFCHPPAGFQCCNHGDVAFPQGERVKGVGRTYASMEWLPLLKLAHVSRIRCRFTEKNYTVIFQFTRTYNIYIISMYIYNIVQYL